MMVTLVVVNKQTEIGISESLIGCVDIPVNEEEDRVDTSKSRFVATNKTRLWNELELLAMWLVGIDLGWFHESRLVTMEFSC